MREQNRVFKQKRENGMNEYDMADLYRQIGRTFHKMGADQVILVCSRKLSDKSEMLIEIAVDGVVNTEDMTKKAEELWPEIKIEILDMSAEGNEELLDEAIECGIIL